MDLARHDAAKLAVGARSMTALLLLVSCQGWAQECVEIPPCQAYGWSSIVFIGKVLETGTSGPGTLMLQVERVYKGVPLGQERVTIFKSGTCHTTECRPGERYVVYASGDIKDVLYGYPCSRTRHISWAQEDLKYLNGLPRAPRGSRIYGSIYSVDPDDDQRTFPGVRIEIAGEGIVRRVLSDGQGRYEVRGLSPGKYTVRAKISGWEAGDEEPVEVPERGCAEQILAFVRAREARIYGHVYFADGKPATGVRLDLIPASTRRQDMSVIPEDVADQRGEFAFLEVPHGAYFLGVNISPWSSVSERRPFPPWFYPGVSTSADARAIVIKPGQKQAGPLRFTLPAPVAVPPNR